MRKILILSVYFIIISILVASCRLTKKATSTKKALNLEQIYDSAYINKINYSTIDAKFNVKYQQGSKNYSLKGTLRILKDSIIWVSIGPGLGIEASRILCTNDSIYILDKFNNSLTKGKYEYLKKLMKIEADYNSLQSILTNQFFIYPKENDEKNCFVNNFTIRDDTTKLSAYRKTEQSIESLITFNKSNFYITDYLINDVANLRTLKINYSKGDFDNIAHFPKTVFVGSSNSGKIMNVTIDYTKLVLNSNPSFSFKTPASYRIIVH